MMSKSNPSAISHEIIERKEILPPLVTFAPKLPRNIHRQRSNFEEIPYDLTEIVRAEDTDSYVAKSFNEHTQLIMREGFAIKSQDEETERYCNIRMKEIQILTGISPTALLRKIARSVVRYCNAYVVKSRVPAPCIGKTYRMNNRDLDPIVGLFVADPLTISILRDHRGRPKMYKQFVPETNGVRFWSPEDVIHISYNHRAGFPYGTPWIIPSLDDVRFLRRFEEHADILGGNFAQPFIVWKIGTDAMPTMVNPETGESETALVKREIQRLAQEGIAIVGHRHNPEALNTSDSGVNLVPYLEYLKDRVVSGVGLSSISLGQGGTANRATATHLMQVAINRCKDIQEVIADKISSTLLFELQLDSGKSFSVANEAYFEFAEIDVEAQQSRENHATALFQAGAMTHTELRREMNLNPFSEEDKNDDFIAWGDRKNRADLEAQKELSLEPQLEMQEKTAKMSAATGLAKSKSSPSSSGNGSKKSIANKNQPSNQYGTKKTKTKVTKNDAIKNVNLEQSILINSLLNKDNLKNNQKIISKTFDKYLDKITLMVDDLTRDIITSFCTRETIEYPDDEIIVGIIEKVWNRGFDESLKNTQKYLISDENKDKIIENVKKEGTKIQTLIHIVTEQLENDLKKLLHEDTK